MPTWFHQDWHYGQECSCTPVGYAYSVRCLWRSVVAYANLAAPRLALRKSFYQDWHYGFILCQLGCAKIDITEEVSPRLALRAGMFLHTHRLRLVLQTAVHGCCFLVFSGLIAQLGEHRLCKPGVKGSIPFESTIFFFNS